MHGKERGRMSIAEEWFDHFIERLESDPKRIRRALGELYRPLPPSVLEARKYDFETEKLRVQLKELKNVA